METTLTPQPVWLSRQSLAERWDMKPKTLAEWATHGKGPRFAKIGGFCRYRLDDVVAWENEQFGGAA